MFYAYPFGQS